MTTPDTNVQMLTPEGEFRPNEYAQHYVDELESLTLDDYQNMYRDMVFVRAFDHEAAMLQRQGQLGLWVPSWGQEAAQIASAYAAHDNDTIFPSYREHAVAYVRGVDPVRILALLRGLTHGGWDPSDPNIKQFRLYTLVIGSHALHATGYALGVKLDQKTAAKTLQDNEAVLAYFGDGATSQGDVHEACVFAASYQVPLLFFVQNNQWAISVPVQVQSRVPLANRSLGYGMPGARVDGNDLLASYAVTAKHLRNVRNGEGPAWIEAITHRMGAHTSSDDPTKYRTKEYEQYWSERDPIARVKVFLTNKGITADFFEHVDEQAEEFALDIRQRTFELPVPDANSMFEHVYSQEHPVPQEQAAWYQQYESSFGESA